MTSKTVSGIKTVVGKDGKTRVVPTKLRVSVSKAIAMKNSKKQKPVRRTP